MFSKAEYTSIRTVGAVPFGPETDKSCIRVPGFAAKSFENSGYASGSGNI
jgi:hypothetical protein